MEQIIYLERLRAQSPPVRVKLSLISHGPNFYIRHQTEDGLNFILKMSSQDLINVYSPMIRAAKSSLNPGIVRVMGDQEKWEKQYSFNLITLDSIQPSLPISQKIALTIERFEHTLPDIAQALRQDYKTMIGQNYPSGEKSQLGRDLETIQHLTDSLVKNDQLIYGGQAKIAKALNVKNAGAGHRRIKGVVEALLSSTTTAQNTAPAPPKQQRVA